MSFADVDVRVSSAIPEEALRFLHMGLVSLAGTNRVTAVAAFLVLIVCANGSWLWAFRSDARPEDGSMTTVLFDAVGAGERPPTEGERGRSLASDFDQDGLAFRIMSQDFFASDRAKPVLVHTPSPGLPPSNDSRYTCEESAIRNLVFSPNDTVFYYIAEEKCALSNDSSRITHHLLSVRKADLRPVKEGRKPHVEEKVITYGWSADSPSGAAVTSPDMILWNMALVDGMDLSGPGTHLVLSSRPSRDPLPANLVLLSLRDGNRSAIPMPAERLQSLAFSPAKTTLYAVDNLPPVRLLSAPVAESGVPLGDASVKTVITLAERGGGGGEPATWTAEAHIGPQSLVLNGSCVYSIAGAERNRLIGIALEPDSPSSSTLIAGDGDIDPTNDNSESALNASFGHLHDLVATPDGCNILVAESAGYVRWVSMESPCKISGRVETVLSYPRGGLAGLALQSYGGGLYLYLGSNDSRLFEMEIKQSKLRSSCIPAGGGGNTSTLPIGSTNALDSGNLALAICLPAAALIIAGVVLLCSVRRWKRRTNGG